MAHFFSSGSAAHPPRHLLFGLLTTKQVPLVPAEFCVGDAPARVTELFHGSDEMGGRWERCQILARQAEPLELHIIH